MSFDPLSSLFDLGKTTIERIWPDANKRSEEMRKLEALRQEGDLHRLDSHVKLLVAQVELNKVEAEHKSLFVAGWRPFIGWIGGISLAYAGIVHNLLAWAWAFYGLPDAPPELDSSAILPIVMGMLGIGGMRSFDKSRNTETNSLS